MMCSCEQSSISVTYKLNLENKGQGTCVLYQTNKKDKLDINFCIEVTLYDLLLYKWIALLT